MKTITRVLRGFFGLLLLQACIGEEVYDLPYVLETPPQIATENLLSIGALYNLWWQQTEGEGILSLGESYDEKYLEGFVISSDEAGNFFEELYLQDAPENPQRGLKVLIDSSPLFTRFDLGRKVYIQLQGLSLGLNSGVFSIGLETNNSIAPISEIQMNRHILRDTVVAQLLPKAISIGAVSPELTNLYVRLTDVQFHKSQLREGAILTYAAEEGDTYDGERLLESCSQAGKIVFSTSSFADFKGVTLATGSGSIEGIPLFDYYGERLVFSVNDLNAIQLENEQRCDAEAVVCPDSVNGSEILWEMDFEGIPDLEGLLEEGWTLYSPLDGETTWEVDAFGGNTYLRISGYNADEPAIESWVVSPEIDLGNFQEKTLGFEVQVSYDNGAQLQVLVSTDFDGDPSTATWFPLDVLIPPGPYQGFGDVLQIGPVSLSCFEGPIVLAWVYEGSDPYKTTRFHVDTIEIKTN